MSVFVVSVGSKKNFIFIEQFKGIISYTRARLLNWKGRMVHCTIIIVVLQQQYSNKWRKSDKAFGNLYALPVAYLACV